MKNNSNMMTSRFWMKAWEEARKNSSSESSMIRSNSELIDYYSQYALRFDQLHSPVKRTQRVQQVLDILQHEGFLTPKSDVLDIGCGSGNYTLPFAELCSNVTAIDGALEMCRHLKSKVQCLDLKNIRVQHKLWEELDLVKEGMHKKFDLVFASMTEAISDYETLQAMNDASKENCCLVFWAGTASNKVRSELWEKIFNKPDPGYGTASVIYPFNLLYSLGYYPSIHFFDTEWMSEESIDQAIEGLTRFFWLYADLNSKIIDIITHYVNKNAVNGTLLQKTEATLGVVTWKVNKTKDAISI